MVQNNKNMFLLHILGFYFSSKFSSAMPMPIHMKKSNLPTSQQEWDKMKADPYYANDPLCCEAEIPGGELIMKFAMAKKNDNVNDMTYEQLITWKKYTYEQMLDMEFGPADARWRKVNAPYLPDSQEMKREILRMKERGLENARQRYQMKLYNIRSRKQEIERRKAEQEKKEQDKIILEKQRNEQILKMKALEEQKKLIEEKRLKKMQRDKEVIEYLEDFIPETNLEKIAYAQYIQNKKLIGTITSMDNYISSRI